MTLRTALLALSTLCLFVVTGCYATTGYYDDVPDAYVDVPPPGFIATAPVYYYEGRPVYFYHDHWHYRDRGGWRSFRQEPPPLRGVRPEYGRGHLGPGPAPMMRGAPRAMPAPSGPAPMMRGGPRPMPGPAAPPARGRASPRMWEGRGHR